MLELNDLFNDKCLDEALHVVGLEEFDHRLAVEYQR